MKLPKEWMGYSTIELLDLWDRMHKGQTTGDEEERKMAYPMNSFLDEHNLLPVLWKDEKKDRERAQRLIAELRQSQE